ncbi:hypothetical protein SAMN06298223_0700 [Olsenella sp. KH1P3]|uniref:Uncharacterized protein n=1 Tax=Parafannyhessea umbonata TaxID=604330 RepID=A0A1H9P1N7_9ACTN|nr:hypothetical protein SAMN05216447_10239 [Parafannyhessea umbonata]SER42021.1 hypothetical protein SAMN05216446_0752 [Parafannyhessea umbonata]SJZ55482.1 hypothetical protein SAMN06298223_0700 [Olsenella sp. KH1P3]
MRLQRKTQGGPPVHHAPRCRVGRGERGETLAETLVAILICTLASVMLLAASATAARLSRQAEDREGDLWEQRQAAESDRYVGSRGSDRATVQVDGRSHTMLISGGDDIVSYRLTGEEP